MIQEYRHRDGEKKKRNASKGDWHREDETIYIHTYIHTHIHTYTHTYIHTYIIEHTHIHTVRALKLTRRTGRMR
jgi:hypothetical protein